MIVVKIIGGLGNQLFQVAYAIHLSSITNKKIYIDSSIYDKYKIRSYALDELNVSHCISNYSNISDSSYKWIKVTHSLYRIYQKVMKTLKVDKYGHIPFYVLSKFGLFYNFDRFYYEHKGDINSNVYIYGYFQSEKYFIEHNSLVKDMFKVTKSITDEEMEMLTLIKASTSVAVSMRLGDDYVNTKHLNVCDEEYYYSAIALAAERLTDPTFFIFSDDIVKAKTILDNNPRYIFVEGFSDVQSLRLMYHCENFVISNSSFSWWGAYLSDYHDKIVIAPKIWFKFMKNEPDIFFDKMIKL